MIANPLVFIGLREIAGYFSNLKRGFEELGVKCTLLDLAGNPSRYDNGQNPLWVRWLSGTASALGVHFARSFVLRFIWLTVFQSLFSIVAFVIAVVRYDVFILGGNSTFFFFLELPLLRLLGKKVIYVFLGSDSRPIYLNGAAYKGEGNVLVVKAGTWVQKRVVRVIESLATACINHPPQAYFHERPFISVLYIGLPYAGPTRPPEAIVPVPIGQPVQIIHIPSKAGPKGSDRFRAIIERLKLRHEIEYTEMSGITNSEVLKIITQADFALDEFFSDSPMAVFATECAFHSVPVVVGSYYASEIENDYAREDLPPSMFVHPDNMEQAIEKMIVDTRFRQDLGRAAYTFVSTRWKARDVAARYLQIVDGTSPPAAWYDPYRLRYVHGAGLHEDELRTNIKQFTKGGDTSSLMLNDKPEVIRALITQTDFDNG
jgi:glycosyltransferase involved in cell wall biosynthesis